jgi:hypothetical protein
MYAKKEINHEYLSLIIGISLEKCFILFSLSCMVLYSRNFLFKQTLKVEMGQVQQHLFDDDNIHNNPLQHYTLRNTLVDFRTHTSTCHLLESFSPF